ncbi:uncharacterized protein LOC132750384 [Ruditapes philippinarum]|uniref:uncharacterized protein LOC132750384 n=1 Tax=Ruditapes philippinarum TaxID=129788 RepID=UPI00295BDD64|nr:uncharacterized protein LOC132750384 [Ruditapes philippinarum]
MPRTGKTSARHYYDRQHKIAGSQHIRATPGTRVTITCLANTSHKLFGENELTCQQNGTWSAATPTCEYVSPTTIAPTTPSGGRNGTDDVERMTTWYSSILPYLAALIILLVVCILLISLLCYSFHLLKKQKRKSPFPFESTRSSTPSSSLHQTDLWVEMASPRHFRSHELALPRDSMVQELRYTPMEQGWSGY